MKSSKLLILLGIGFWIVITTACSEEPQTPNQPTDPRDLYAGVYEMKKPGSDLVYLMKIEKIGQQCNGCDSLRFINYGDLFTFRNVRYAYAHLPGYIDINVIDPLTDKFGRRWKVTGVGNPNPPHNINVAVNDTLIIQFKLNNSAYFAEDGVPEVVDSIITHTGVRIADIE